MTFQELSALVCDATGYILNLLGIGKLISWGTTVPGDTSTGYAKSGLFFHTDGATNDALLYINAGSTTSSQFVKLSDIALGLNKTVSGSWTFASAFVNAYAVGSLPTITGATVVESGDGVVHKTVITFADVDFALTDVAGVVAYVGKKVYDLPEGYIKVLGCVLDLNLTKSSAGVNADWDGDVGVGTVTASNNGTLSSTEQNIVPTTATPQAVAGATTADGRSTATEEVVIDGHTAAADVYLNFLVDDLDQDVTGTPCNLIVNGTLTLTWMSQGDN